MTDPNVVEALQEISRHIDFLSWSLAIIALLILLNYREIKKRMKDD